MADFYASQFERAKTLRVVPRMVHQSFDPAMYVNPDDPDGPPIRLAGVTLNIGRNKRKREHRASKESRKHWRRVA